MRKPPTTAGSFQSRRLLWAVVLGLSGLSFSIAVAEVPDLIPARAPGREAPAWISADAAVRNGGIDPRRFSPEEAISVQQALEADLSYRLRTDNLIPKDAGQGKCVLWTTTSIDWEDGLPNRSLPALLSNAKAVLLGTVIDSQQGFYFGQPGSLYEVKVDRTIKYPGPQAPRTVLVFYQFAKIPVGDAMLCAKAGRGEAEVPALGARVAVFSYRSTGDEAEVIVPDEEEFFFETQSGDLSVPPGVKGLPEAMAFESLIRALDRLSQRGS